MSLFDFQPLFVVVAEKDDVVFVTGFYGDGFECGVLGIGEGGVVGGDVGEDFVLGFESGEVVCVD